MISKRLIFNVLIFSFFCEFGFAQDKQKSTILPVNFAENSFKHIVNISNVGVHTAGSGEEKKVSEYIKNELSEFGIVTSTEAFEFESFDITETELKINGKRIEAKQIGFNPYNEIFQFNDNFVLLDSSNTSNPDIKKKIVVASFPLDNSKYFELFFKTPKLIVVIPALDFQKIANQQNRKISCIVKGGIRKHKSQNIVGEVKGKQNTSKEIILTAHYDSYPGSIGADDNASGVGVLIELAKYFKQNPINMNLKFVAFGGEEKGLLGSRAYLNKHSKELANCKLLFNLDQLGGNQIFIEATAGVKGISEIKGKSQFPEFMRNRSLEGIETNWRLLAPEVLPLLAVCNRPDWLVQIIKESITELSIPVTYTGNTGSDQMTFAQAGIAVTAIGTSGNEVHSPNDIPSQVNKKSIYNCGKIAANIILKTAQK